MFFENENLSSFDPKIEFVISVLSGLAEEEARNVSENVKWNVRKRFKEGKVKLNGKKVFGYLNDKEGNFVIDELQATAVWKIYELYNNGSTSNNIIDWLEMNKYKTDTGNKNWNKTSITYILKNDIYTGTLTMQKTLRPNYRSKNKVKNEGQLPMYQVHDSHPAIITKKDYEVAQEIRKSRIKKYHNKNGIIEKEIYLSSSKYSGVFYCPHCGKNYRYKINNRKSNNPNRILVCASNISRKTCQSYLLQLDVIDNAIIEQINKIIINKDSFFIPLNKAFYNGKEYKVDQLELKQTQGKISVYKEQLQALKESNGDFSKELENEINEQLIHLEQQKVILDNRFKIEYDYDKFVHRFNSIIKMYDDSRKNFSKVDFRQLFSKVVVINRDKLIFIIGNNFIPTSINSSTKTILNGSLKYQIRKTDYVLKYGIYLC